jgi:ABC-type multidrug transport system ATPase subunit/ABC-type multidrug transport system permease subunit
MSSGEPVGVSVAARRSGRPGVRHARVWAGAGVERRSRASLVVVGDDVVDGSASGAGVEVAHRRAAAHRVSASQVSAVVTADDGADPLAVSLVSAEIDCLDVQALSLSLTNGRKLLSDVSFSGRPGSLTAIIGPSGAGKSTLAKLVGGALAPTAGDVRFGGHCVHGEYASLRHRIGLVPQDDIVHHQLTVRAALRFAAELRLPNAGSEERAAAVARVLEELELTSHADTPVDKLSGGQRKRASVAMELLTEPALLILDEPTTGLDPALDRQVMTTLRRLADAGRVVLVVTHCLTYLDVCDQVLFLTPGGKTAYCGPAHDIGAVLGETDWAELFARVSADPDTAHRDFLTRRGGNTTPAPLPQSRPVPQPCRLLRQASTVARRQARLILADRGYLVFLAVLPFILGALSLLVPGETGLAVANPRSNAPDEPVQIVFMLSISAMFMGCALTVRDLVGERTIFRREQAAGLSATAYLGAKIVVYALTAAIQTAVLTTIVVAGKGVPTRGAVMLGNPVAELYLTLAATAVVAAVMGLTLSALAKSQEQILPMLVLSMMLSIVFCGGMIPVSGRPVLDQLSWASPARWGFAATASTTDLTTIAPVLRTNDDLWSHDTGWWSLNMTMLIVLATILTAGIRWRTRLRLTRSRSLCLTTMRCWRRLLPRRSSPGHHNPVARFWWAGRHSRRARQSLSKLTPAAIDSVAIGLPDGHARLTAAPAETLG